MKRTLWVSVILFAASAGAFGAPLVTDTFTGSDDGWAILSTSGGTVGNAGGNLVITNGAGALPAPQDYFYDNLYNSGYYTGVNTINFRFRSDNAAPGLLTLYFTDAGNATWYYDITGLAATINNLQLYSITMDYPAGWHRSVGVESQLTFDNAKASVDEIGFWITYRPSEGGADIPPR